MALSSEDKEKRAIKKEQKRLTEIYAEVEEKKRNLVIGLIENAAFARVKLQSLAAVLSVPLPTASVTPSGFLP